MSALDRDEAREVLRFLLPDGDVMEALLDAIEECVQPFTWQDLENLLAEHYPEDIFPVRADAPSVDPGPRILALARLLHRSEAKLEAIEAIHQQGGVKAPGYPQGWCLHDHHPWPCPTVRVIGEPSANG